MADALLAASQALIYFLNQGIGKCLDSERLARVGVVLLNSNKSSKEPIFIKLADYLTESQQPDGGWVDIEETAWSLAYLRKMPEVCWESSQKGLEWLASQKRPGGGWGKNNRDKPRIPHTSWVALLLPELVSLETLQWLENECRHETSQQPLLTYKIALPLRAFYENRSCPEENIWGLISLLLASQNEDGGFAPWRGHPGGSDPWCTAVAVLGLLPWTGLVPREVMHKALKWLRVSQLPNGMWPYHYIEEGTAIAYWALNELSLLKE
ncbi:MAG: hypothetical protein M1571_07825 [Firmicutes bacterium]|nr:hypothetical protein [Bacillota bacterium]